MIKSRSMVELTPELEAEIRARTKIRPDEPGTNPGDPGNGYVLVVDETHQKFGGRIYYRKDINGYYINKAVVDGKNKTESLHVAVWQFHNGAKPARHVVHHDHKDANGQWDTSFNDIEHLLLMTYSEHRLYHSKYKPPVVAPSGSTVDMSGYRADENLQIYIPRARGGRRKVIRYCWYCRRPFETDIDSLEISCDRADCRGKELANTCERAMNTLLQDLTEHCGCRFKISAKRFEKPIRCLFIDGEISFIAKDIQAALEHKNLSEAKAEFYPLSFLSTLPAAKAFAEWMTSIVLPAVNEYSKYISGNEAAPMLILPDGTNLVFVDVDDHPYDFSHNEKICVQSHISI